MAKQRVIDPLSKEEKKALRHCETVIKRGVRTFVEVGNALKEIQESQLYRERHTTFEDYCKNRWDISRAHAYRLIESAKVVEDVSPTGDAPLRESQARPLTRLKSAQERQEVWEEAKAASPTGKPTARLVEEAVARQRISETMETVVEPEVIEADTGETKLGVFDNPDGVALWYWCPVIMDGTVPTLQKKSLMAPTYTQPPSNSDDPEDNTVLVCPDLDLFDRKVTDSVLEAVLEAAEQTKKWTFMILSENYDRMFSYAYPDNIWVGARVSDASDLVRAESASLKGRARNKFLYCSPLVEDIQLSVPLPFSWVIIGGSDPQPLWDHVWAVTAQAVDIHVPILWATSLHVRPQERPE